MLKKGYSKLCNFILIKCMAIIMTIAFLFSLLPIGYLSFFNRASGDDYGYGALTHEAWQTTHSMIEVCKAAGETIRQYYDGWQGTWFSIFVFSMQPEVFSDQLYVIVAFVMLFIWIGSTILLFRTVLVNKFKFSKWAAWLITVIFLFISIQFIPSTKSSIFWFNGAAHYMIPFAMCQTLLYNLLKYAETFKKRHFIIITILMTLLGGSNYQMALFSLIVTGYIVLWKLIIDKKQKILLLIIPILMNLAGLIVSMKAPGNKVRGGKEFGFSFVHVIETIGMCFLTGLQDMIGYAKQKPLVFVGLLLIIAVCIAGQESDSCSISPCHRIWIIIAGWLVYFAMQAPAVYAGVDVSGGVFNTNYQVFLLATLLTIVCLMRNKIKLHAYVGIPILIACSVLLVMFRSNIKDTTTWKCMAYITTGQAEDYREQMNLQTKLLNDPMTDDVVLPFINDEQGPLMHMPVTGEEAAWTNKVTKEFYRKNSVVAMPRVEWEEIYLNK